MGKKTKEKKNKLREEKDREPRAPRYDDYGEGIRYKYLRWYKLDNSAHLFPVIAGEKMTNTYRLCAELTEDIDRALLQKALDQLLPKFDPFNVRMRRGFFWYYLEENGRRAPLVKEEASFPCSFIHSKLNHDYMFRVSYYGHRINLEVFHVLTDGMGGLNFLKELVYHYLRLKHPEIHTATGEGLSDGTSMNLEDSFLKNYRKASKPLYAVKKAYRISGEHLRDNRLGIMNFSMSVDALKEVSHKYGLSINEFLVGTYVYSIYVSCLHAMKSKRPIRVAVPVNLRSYFDSVTTKNFFAVVSAELPTDDKDGYTYEEILDIVKEGLRAQVDKEHLEGIFSYNVSNQANIFLRILPLTIKNIAMRFVYTRSALANTSTMTNLGNIKVDDAYKPYISNFYAMLAMSKGQFIKATICSFDDTMNVTFSSLFRDVSIQHCFIKRLALEGLEATLETNGVYYG